jgi:hypothetical protein
MRTALHGVGLPIDSVAVAKTKTTETELQRALSDHNPTAVKTDARALKSQLSTLTPGDWHQVAPRADTLLQQAQQLDGSVGNPTTQNRATATTPSQSAKPQRVVGDNPDTHDRQQPTTTTTIQATKGGSDQQPSTTTSTTTTTVLGDDGDSSTTTIEPDGSDGGMSGRDGGSPSPQISSSSGSQ